MHWSYLALLIAALLPIVCAGIAKAGMRDYDNHDPRTWLARQTGQRARANAAQANSFEAFPFFAAGVLLALHAGVTATTIDLLAWAFVVTRAIYIWCYVNDRATWRSIWWTIGHACVIALFVLAMLR